MPQKPISDVGASGGGGGVFRGIIRSVGGIKGGGGRNVQPTYQEGAAARPMPKPPVAEKPAPGKMPTPPKDMPKTAPKPKSSGVQEIDSRKGGLDKPKVQLRGPFLKP